MQERYRSFGSNGAIRVGVISLPVAAVAAGGREARVDPLEQRRLIYDCYEAAVAYRESTTAACSASNRCASGHRLLPGSVWSVEQLTHG